MSLPTGAWIGFGMLLGGQISWKLAAHRATSWLTANDPSYEAPGVGAKLVLGGLFTSFGPMAQYASRAREQGAPLSPVYAFWGGFFVSLLGGVVILATVMN